MAEAAAGYWRTTERYLGRLAELAGDAFRPVGSLRLAADEAERDELRAEYDALRKDGFEAEWLDELAPPLSHFRAAIRQPGDGALQPARWVRRLAGRAAEAGVEIHEHTRVESLDELDADLVVVATDGYTHSLLPELDAAVQPTRGQVVVTEPLADRLFPCPHSARHGFDYWHQTPDGRLVAGGRRDTTLEAEYTAEGSAGYSGHGNVMGLACGELVAQAILDRPAPELAIFDPARLLPEGRAGPSPRVLSFAAASL